MDYIINTNSEWDAAPRARHQIAESIAKSHNVYFVAASKIGLPDLNISSVKKRLTIITPSFPIDYRIRYRIPILNELYQLWLFPKLKKYFESADNIYVICSDFTAYKINNYFEHVAFYCNDDHINNIPSPWLIKKYHELIQKKMVQESLFSIVTARYLYEKFIYITKKVHEIPLGAPEINIETRKEIKRINNKIRIVLLGYLNTKKTPVNLINKISNELDVQLIFIGPIEDNFLELLDKPDNVISTGILTGNALYQKMTEADVGIVPYFMNDPNLGRTPNKLWQYLAVGIPVVVTNLPNIRHWEFPEDFIYKANNDEDFVEYIKIAIKKNTDSLKKSRIEFAKKNTWDNRTQEITKLFETYCK